MRRFLGFTVVGGLGFVVDGGLLMALIPVFGHYASRLVSFSIAVVTTWWLNRSLTFRDRRDANLLRELARYVGSQSLGAATNLAVYTACVATSDWFHANPFLAFALGSAAGLVVNFSLAHFLVFRAVNGPRG